MRKLIACLLAALPVAGAHAQCPVIYNCPQGSPVVCDLSSNDPLLWNDPPYTLSEVHDTADLYEGVAEFSLKILPCVGAGNVKVSYTLLLDLDNDNLRETALTSLDLPPAGIIYTNNAFNPDYSGGDPAEFDKRAVPDSLKFRFALEISNIWDTLVARLCWQTGDLFVSPRLPEGRHHLLWRVEQDDVVRYCEYSFRLRDCQSPTIECMPASSVSLDSNSTAMLFWDDILIQAEDNTTPLQLLEFSMRKSGNGNGYPLDSSGSGVLSLAYNCEELDTQVVELWVKDRLGNAGFCQTTLVVTDDDGVCIIPPSLCAHPYWNTEDFLKPVTFKMIWVDTAQKLIQTPIPLQPDGCGMMSFLPPSSSFSLVAECDTLPLNGVSTYDLLLISKHIIGIQPFDAPWKWIAADANKSGSVTTFDVVELRKLILGIYTKLPVNTSWRLFPADCDFPANPFTAYCPNEYSFITTPLWEYPAEISFNALKTGDVNGTANLSSFGPEPVEIRGEPAFLRLPEMTLQTGRSYDIPLVTTETGAWLGFQFGLYFDPDVVEIESIAPGLLPDLDENSFAQPAKGVLNASWFSPTPHTVAPGENLTTIRVRALQTAQISEIVRFRDDGPAPELYTTEEVIRPLRIRIGKNSTFSGTSVAAPQPNPTTAGAIIPLHLTQPELVTLELADFSGIMIFQTEQSLGSGSQMLEIPASAFPVEGMYAWRVKAGGAVQVGKIIRR